MSKKLFFFFLFLLVILALRFVQSSLNVSNYSNGEKVSFETTLMSQPKIFGRYQRFFVESPKGVKIFTTAFRYPEFHYGQTLIISGTVQLKVLGNKKPINSMFLPQIEASKKPSNSVISAVGSFREKIVAIFQNSLPPTSSSLLLGIVFGIKEGMPKVFMENLRISGVLHVIAASGMNVTMVAAFLSGILAVFFSRRIAIIASIIGIGFYALMSGLEPSIIRASIMGTLVFTAQILGKQALSFYSLLLTGYLMLFFSPGLVLDIGFQLSFTSTLGLLYIRPLFQTKRLKKIIKMSIIGEDMTTSFAAQAATLPILFANFGSYSLLSIAVNGLVLWTVPFLMMFGAAGAILGMVFEPIARPFLYLALPFLLYFEKMVNFFAVQGGVISLNSFPWQFIISYYLVLTSLILIIYKRRRQKI